MVHVYMVRKLFYSRISVVCFLHSIMTLGGSCVLHCSMDLYCSVIHTQSITQRNKENIN